MNAIESIQPAFGIGDTFVGVHFVDAYRVTVDAADLDATSSNLSRSGVPSIRQAPFGLCLIDGTPFFPRMRVIVRIGSDHSPKSLSQPMPNA